MADKNGKTKPGFSGSFKSISVKGYKSFGQEQKVEIRPLTIFAGANSSGKSSVMQPLMLMKQTLEATYDPGPVKLDGPNVRFTSSDQIYFKEIGKPGAKSFSVRLEINNGDALTTTFEKQHGQHESLNLLETRYETDGRTISLRLDMAIKELIQLIPAQLEELRKRLAERGSDIKWVIERERCFLTLGMKVTSLKSQNGEIFSNLATSFNALPSEEFESQIRRVIHVPGLRGNPVRTYGASSISVGEEFPGTFENYVASVINHWQTNKDERLSKLGTSLKTLGLTWKVGTKAVDATQVELQVGRLPQAIHGGAKDMVNIADVGFGVSQTLPVLVALLTASPGQLVFIEQPEIHLHPRAQVAMARLLADAANSGVRVVVETHSDLLILATQTLVAEGYISADKVKLHWFERSNDGSSKVTSADLDEAGVFGEWPADFGDVRLDAQSKYLDAAETVSGMK